MYILLFLNFILTCCIGVFLFNQLKEKEDEIEELYNLYYNHIEEDKNIKSKINKGKVLRIDSSIF